MPRADEDTEEYAATEEYEEETEEYVKEYTRMDYEKTKVVSLASGRRHEQAIVVLGVRVEASRAMKRSSSEVYINEDVDVRCVPPALVEQKRSRQQGCASSDEERHLPQQLAFVTCDGPEGESLSGPIIPSSRTNCLPCIRK